MMPRFKKAGIYLFFVVEGFVSFGLGKVWLTLTVSAHYLWNSVVEANCSHFARVYGGVRFSGVLVSYSLAIAAVAKIVVNAVRLRIMGVN